MIEVKDALHTVKYLATQFDRTDIFRVVRYVGFRGDLAVVPKCFSRSKSNSCYTDLTHSMDEILSSMNSTSRNEIRRAIKEGCEFRLSEDIDSFVPFYNSFCKSKGFDDSVTKERILIYKKILITEAIHQGVVLAKHISILDPEGKQAVLLFSCSQRFDANVDKKLIGWGNRFLHYKDLEYLKENGYTYYDWSGVVLDPEDDRYPIGQFKLSLGGTVIDCYVLRSPLFRFLENIRSVINHLRHR